VRSNDQHAGAGSEALVFLHVPKTAGSTLSWIIERQYPADRSLRIEGEGLSRKYQAFQAMPESSRRELRCVLGHMPFGVHRWLPQGARYITMLRHPVAWTLSFYTYIRRNAFFDHDPDLVALRGTRGLDLDGFVDFLTRSNLADWQTRQVSGDTLMNLLPPFEPMKDDTLDRAKENLRSRFECVGIVERFDESLLLMQQSFGWPKPYYRRLNVTDGGSRTEMPSSIVNRILACHSRDVELYEHGCRLLSDRIDAAGKSFQGRLRRFRRLNSIYSALLPAYEASGLQRLRDALRRARRVVR
jgi:hypothetical protein